MSTPHRQRGRSTVYGYPRQGPNRELKKATESYWAGRSDSAALTATAREVRLQRLRELVDAGIGEPPSNDFSLYDHVLDTAVMLGAIPTRHRAAVRAGDTEARRLDQVFAMARGDADVAPLEMTKWFDTNYHYLVPELGRCSEFGLDPAKPLTEFGEALDAGTLTRPVILGPVSFLVLARAERGEAAGFEPLDLLDDLVAQYAELLRELAVAGAQWVQFDEPVLVTDQPARVLAATRRAYTVLADVPHRPRLLVASYFDRLGDALPVLAELPVEGLAMDFTGPAQANLVSLEEVGGLPGKRLVAGVVDGRNVWAADLTRACDKLEQLSGLAERVDVAASCSLLHVPLDVRLETDLDPEVAPWLSFARQKLDELDVLARALVDGRAAVGAELAENRRRLAARAASSLVRDEAVRARCAAVGPDQLARRSGYPQRHDVQSRRLRLPALPTTTIGSLPQTAQLRNARADLRSGRLDAAGYDETIRAEIRSVISHQERLGLDVLVHGEPERSDMVEYFAERLTGFLTTTNGWVQSYGSRYVRPPIIVGDVSRPRPMTVGWSGYAQSLTDLPVKGMLTGPVTMLAWSFVRDDQPTAETARQIALALRDEVDDLQAAGIGIIQVDEPALREMLPLRESGQADYLAWAVDAFRLTTSGADDQTQIQTHMCYAEFGDVLQAIVDMDPDVISLEAARSQQRIVAELAATGYPNEVGPGVWDIHSPRIPAVDEIAEQLRAAVAVLPADRLWVNPDCGLKTRDYDETLASLANLVTAARMVRGEL